MSIAHPSIRSLAVAFALLAPMHVTVAFAQTTGAPPPPGGPANAAGNNTAPAGGGGSTTSSTTTQTFFPGGVAPVPAGGTLGGGNTQFSSSKPITGNQEDSFDFKGQGGGGGTARGNENSSFVLGGGDVRGAPSNSGTHLVRKGDTLWDICDHYFRNPYQWPRIWAFNPQIQNPHWIFPGDQVRLRGGQLAQVETSTGSAIIDRRRQVPPDTVFLRTEGFIDDARTRGTGAAPHIRFPRRP